MKRTIALHVALIALIGGAFQAKATQVGLADWCVNLNGDDTTACNGAGSGNATINLGSFDTTLEPTSNTLGTITVKLAQGAGQYVSFYVDYDVSNATWGAFDDSAKTTGALPAGMTYELADPNSGSLFHDFANNAHGTLANTNTVGTPAGPPNPPCCDAAVALSAGGINVGAGGTTVTFTVSTVAPTSGFYITQTNTDTKDSIYLQESVGPVVIVAAPEPSSIFLVGLSLVGGALVWKRRRLVDKVKFSV